MTGRSVCLLVLHTCLYSTNGLVSFLLQYGLLVFLRGLESVQRRSYSRRHSYDVNNGRVYYQTPVQLYGLPQA